MQEDTFDLRIAHSSPLFTASPITGNRTTGWATLCTASGYPCDAPDQSAVYTALANATMELSFWGSRIEVRGNATGGMDLAWELDGSAKTPDVGAMSSESPDAIGEKLGNGLLGVFGGLESGKMHTLKIITRPGLPSAVMAFEGVVVTVGTGVTGGTMSRTFWDDDHPELIYTRTGWARYNIYTSPDYNVTLPQGVVNGKFQCAKEPGASVSMTFNGKYGYLVPAYMLILSYRHPSAPVRPLLRFQRRIHYQSRQRTRSRLQCVY
ncbi:hypothetical protein FRC08_018100 [Ceratobasidium sp. 394]|nr:hypothetical protein FRC08_018100 [Ceratobasidium sp. 394]